MIENVERNLRLFRELLTCVHHMYFWTYDTRFSLVYSNCPSPETIGLIFLSASENLSSDIYAPILISSNLGFTWAVSLERDGNGLPLYYHVIGPTITSGLSIPTIKDAIEKHRHLSPSLNESIDTLLNLIPTIPVPRLMEYGLMLHYCITGEKKTISDFVYPETIQLLPMEGNTHTENPHGTWLMEQKLLNLITEGNLNYKQEASRLVLGTVPAELGNGDTIRHYKNLNISFISSCTRAAIHGGLSPETAYLLSDKYIRNIEACNTLSEIAEVNGAMQDDFVHRVHACKTSNLSLQIQQCCDYIQIHIEDSLTLSDISSAIGYTPSWLSGKFRKETGKTVSQYIAEHKIQRAKELLIASNTPVQEIADQLNFKSQSHFGELFRRHTGMTPGAYRAGKSDK